MSIEFRDNFSGNVSVTYPVLPHLHCNSQKLDDRVVELLEMFSEQYQGARDVKPDFKREWGYVKVSAETMGEMLFDHQEFICPIPFVADDEYTLPNLQGSQILISGWEAGVAIMFMAMEEYITFCTYAA